MSSRDPSVRCVFDRFLAPVAVRVDLGFVVSHDGREGDEVEDGPLTV